MEEKNAVLVFLLLAVACAPFLSCDSQNPLLTTASTRQPVIIDTDVGSFIDDSFAIVYAALSPMLDIKLVVTCTGDTTGRAKVAAKLLKMMGRDDIPIGVGIKNENQTHDTLFDWASEEDLKSYKGGVFDDGVAKMGEIISKSKQVVDIIAIGAMTNFPMLLKKYPDVVHKARVRAMAGSIYVGYQDNPVPAAEYNVAVCPWCMELLLQSNWSVTITPLDTCGDFALDADELKQTFRVDRPASRALASTLLYFCIANVLPHDRCNLTVATPILYDVIATLLALPEVGAKYLVYEEMKVHVNGTGFTVVDDKLGASTSVALHWKEGGEKGFGDMLATLYST